MQRRKRRQLDSRHRPAVVRLENKERSTHTPEYVNADGRFYYHHLGSGNTQWDAPPGWGQALMARLALMHTPQAQLDCTPMQTPQTQKKYEGMKVDELKNALTSRKLSKSGKKADLVQVIMISTAPLMPLPVIVLVLDLT